MISSGCISPDARFDMHEVSDGELAELTTEDYQYLRAINPSIKSTFLNGSSRSTADLPYSVLEYGEPVAYNGSFYKINRTKVGEKQEVAVRYTGKIVESDKETEINFSKKDKEIIRQAKQHVDRSDYRNTEKIFGGDYTPEEFKKSNIIKYNQLYISEKNTTFLLKKEEVRNTSAEIYNYTSQKTTDSIEQWTDKLKEKYMITVNPSNHSRNFLENTTEGYYGEETREFANTVDILTDRKSYRETEGSGKWIVSYKNNTYWVEASWTDLNTE